MTVRLAACGWWLTILWRGGFELRHGVARGVFGGPAIRWSVIGPIEFRITWPWAPRENPPSRDQLRAWADQRQPGPP